MKQSREPADRIESVIKEFVETSPENSLENPANDRAFDSPLVGFSSGDDQLYQDYRVHVGPFHWTPKEVFALAFPNLKIGAEEISVISWVLPQTEATRKENRRQDMYLSESWARARIFGEKFNDKVRKHLVEYLSGGRPRSSCPRVAPKLEEGRIRAVHLCLNVVRASCCVRIGTWHFRALRWTDYPQGSGHALSSVGLESGFLHPRALRRPYQYCLFIQTVVREMH